MPVRSRKLITLSVLLSVALLLSALSVACGADDPGGESVTGDVVSVQERSLTEFEFLTIVDGQGKDWTFVGGAFTGFTPSHLREHMALREPVRVWYVEEGGILTATRIADAGH